MSIISTILVQGKLFVQELDYSSFGRFYTIWNMRNPRMSLLKFHYYVKSKVWNCTKSEKNYSKSFSPQFWFLRTDRLQISQIFNVYLLPPHISVSTRLKKKYKVVERSKTAVRTVFRQSLVSSRPFTHTSSTELKLTYVVEMGKH